MAVRYCFRRTMLAQLTSGGRRLERAISVGYVLVRDDPSRLHPHQQLTLHRIAPAVLVGPVCAHVATPEACSPVQQIGVSRGEIGEAFDQNEMEGRVFLVDAEADAGIFA